MNHETIPAELPLSFEPWREQVIGAFCPMDLDRERGRDGPFRGALASCALPQLRVVSVASGPLRVGRDRRHIGEANAAFYLAKFQLEGEGLLRQRGREALLRPGDFALCSSSDPYELHFRERYRQVVLAIPQQLLAAQYGPVEDYLGLRMAREETTHRLLSHFVSGLVAGMESLPSAVLGRLEANLLELLVTSLHAAAATGDAEEAGAAEPLRRIKHFIESNLTNPALSPELIAADAGISKRYLHLLFSREGVTVSRYVRQRRLEACRMALARPDKRQLSTTDIAVHWCFSDASHFYRCFKARYGVTPRQFRLRAQTVA